MPLTLDSPQAAPLVACPLALLLAGCGSITGLDGSSEYACKAPVGVKCDSVSGTYHNALQNNLPAQRPRRDEPAGSAPKPKPSMSQPPANTGAAHAVTVPAGSTGLDAPREVNAAPIRSQSKVLRLWVKPWEDSDRDLHDQSFVYVQIDSGRWLIDHAQQQIRDNYAPIRPPKQASGPASSTTKQATAGSDLAATASQAARAVQGAAGRNAPTTDDE